MNCNMAKLCLVSLFLVIFFFQAEDGIRDHCVTGVQTCALPISPSSPVFIAPATAEGEPNTGEDGEESSRGDAVDEETAAVFVMHSIQSKHRRNPTDRKSVV